MSDAKIAIDGAPFVETIDGVARPVDPGPHEFRVTLASGGTLTRRETVVEGAKAQRFTFDFEPPAPPPPTPERPAPVATRHGPPSPVAIGLAALGVAALGSFGYFGLTGLSQRSDIEKCDPNCSRHDVDEGQRTMLIADISLGVAVLALGGALVVYLTQPRVPVTHAGARRGDF